MLVSRIFENLRQKTHYYECGPTDGPLMFFLHGWPSLSLMWRAQMESFAAEGWQCIAPDLRGYGQSSAPTDREAYTIEEIVQDMAELHDHLGGESAIWVGHDWGSVVAADLAAHKPSRCRGLVLVSLAYYPQGHALQTVVPLVDRSIYPADEYPDGQWDYYRYYQFHFDAAVADLDADIEASLASIFRSGDPQSVGKVSPNALVTQKGGRFGSAHCAPPTSPDLNIWPKDDFASLVQSFETHGFRPSCTWYVNDAAAIAFAKEAFDGGQLSQPVLFINGEYDQICSVNGNRQGDPMRAACHNLTEISMPAGHWLPLECKAESTEAIRAWLDKQNLDGRS